MRITYSQVLILKKLLLKIRNHVAYGKIDNKTLEKLISLRGQPNSENKGKKIDVKKIVEEIEKKGLKKQGLKPFFRLHPPRKGIESKKHFGVGKGVLGDNGEKINKLVEKML